MLKEGRKLAKDFIKAILETEEACRNNENEAKKKSEERKLSAKTDAEKIISDARKDIEKMLDDDKKAVNKSIDSRFQKEILKAEQECTKLSEKADKNRSKVIDMAIESIG